MEEYENINEYMKYFKQQSLQEKQKIVIEQLDMLNDLTDKLCNEIYIDKDKIENKELDDLKKESYTQDDFAEAVMVYIDSIQNSICDYSIGVSDTLDYINSLSENKK